MRHLLTEHVEALSAPGQGIARRIDATIDFVESLLAPNPAYVKAQPAVVADIKASIPKTATTSPTRFQA